MNEGAEMQRYEQEKCERGPVVCARCGHALEMHGRAGYGGCRVNRGGPLAAAVEACRRGVASGMADDEVSAAVARAFVMTRPCPCKRFRKTSEQPAVGPVEKP